MTWHIRRLTPGEDRTVEGGVVIEEPLEIHLDGRLVAVLMRTPGMEKELAVGFCVGEGLIADRMDLALVHHCGRVGAVDAISDETGGGDPLDESRNRVNVTTLPGLPPPSDIDQTAPLIRSGCGRVAAADVSQGVEPVNGNLSVPVQTLMRLLGQITRQQAAYRAVGGIHAAALFDTQGRAIVVCEDVGRHNAVDKAVGYCLLRGIPLEDKILVSTGRASYDMVAKGARVGVQVLASISSPTSLAAELAEALNCTLVGYLRGKTLNVYTHDRRIIVDETNLKEREQQ
jgi:FdhD protein